MMTASRPRRVLRALARASWADRALLAEAGVALALARLAVLALPFRRIAPRLGTPGQETGPTEIPDRLALGRRVGWAITAVSAFVPWRAKCLEQALAGKVMLRRRRVPSTLYLGVARGGDAARAIDAHAWLRTGPLHVTGGASVERYAVLSTFADPDAPPA